MSTAHASLSGDLRIAVLGGGISGMSAAFWLSECLPKACITLYETKNRLGGLIHSRREGEYLVETGPLTFPTGAPATGALMRAAGLIDQCRPCRHEGGVGLWDGHRLVPVPKSPLQVLFRNLLSPRGLLRLLGEPFMPRSPQGKDVSILDFFRRRTGLDFFQSLVEPMAAGVLAGDPAKLSMAANLPKLHSMERDAGSMAKGLWRARRAQRAEMRRSEKPTDLPAASSTPEGCSGLIAALSEELRRRGVDIRLGHTIRSLSRKQGRYVLSAGPSHTAVSETFNSVVSALPSPVLAALGAEWPREVSDFLSGIPHVPMALLYLGFSKEAITSRFAGEGFLVQPKAGERILSCFLPSRMAEARCPKGQDLLRVLAGGARHPYIARLEDRQFQALALPAIRRMLGTKGEPIFNRFTRREGCLPQLVIGHGEGLARTRGWYSRNWPGFFAAGTSLQGPGIENAVVSGRQAAQDVAAYFNRTVASISGPETKA